MDSLLIGRIILVLACCIGLIIQLKSSLDKLSDEDIIRISYTKPLEEGVTPEISFCLAYTDLEVNADNDTIVDIYARSRKVWEAVPVFTAGVSAGFGIKSLSSPAHYPTDSGRSFEDSWLQLWYPMKNPGYGRVNQHFCYHYLHEVHISVYGGVSAMLNMSNPLMPFHMFFVHMKKNIIPSERKLFGTTWVVVPEPLRSEPSLIAARSYELKKIIRKKLNNPPAYPCEESADESDYLQECFLKYSMKELNCVLPNPYKDQNVALNGTKLRLCDQLEDAAKYRAIMDYFSTASFSEFVKELNCRFPCTREEYQIIPVSDHGLPCPFPGGCTNLSWFFLSFRDREVEYITEKWLYDFDNFIADVGGYLGLYLGASILMLYDQATLLLKWIFNKINLC